MNQAELLLNSIFKRDIVIALHTSPIVYIQSYNYSLVEEALLLMCRESNHNPLDISEGNIAVCDTRLKKLVTLYDHALYEGQDIELELEQMMQKILSRRQLPYKDKNIFVIRNVHHLWAERAFVDYLHRINDKYERGEYTGMMCILLMDDQPFSYAPSEVSKYAKVLSIPYPTLNDIEKLLANVEVSRRELANKGNLTKDLARTLLGLDFYEINSIIRTIKQQHGCITKRSIALALSAKKAIVKKSGLIEVCDTDVTLSDIGGLANLVQDIRKKAYIYRNLGIVKSKKFNMPYPKGILIIGMPGCGKSLIAKAISNAFETSLIRLDVNKLMGKYVGESEENLRRALSLAETAQPCILWIDEIEKAFAGANGKGNSDMLIQRLMGQFLTWMQERTSAVYVVATANDVMKSEFMRKGRFDEVYFVDFPSKKDSQAILEKKLQRYEGVDSIFDVSEVRSAAADIAKELHLEYKKVGNTSFNISFSGSEIESLVNNVIEEAFICYLKDLENGVTYTEDYRIKISPQTFYDHINAMANSVMAKQKAPKDEELTAIEKIQKMQDAYNFKNA